MQRSTPEPKLNGNAAGDDSAQLGQCLLISAVWRVYETGEGKGAKSSASIQAKGATQAREGLSAERWWAVILPQTLGIGNTGNETI